MSPREKAFNSIDGVPTYYWRLPGGKPKRYTFYGTDELYSQLVRWKRDLDAYTAPAGYGRITRFVSAGAYVKKAGQHGKGRAFDIDQVRWSTGRTCTPYLKVHRSSRRVYRLRYYALDAVCRQHFRYVLDANYDRAHHDHIHIDLGGMPVRFKSTSSSDVLFIQAVCNLFGGEGLKIDGQWGPKTRAALSRTGKKAGMGSTNPVGSVKAYRRFMQRVSQEGFRGRTF